MSGGSAISQISTTATPLRRLLSSTANARGDHELPDAGRTHLSAGGHAHNVIPAEVRVGGTVRTFDPLVQDRIEQRMRQMLCGIEASFEVQTMLDYDRYYPATINDAAAAADALEVAASVARAELAPEPAATSEDFSFMLQQRPGAYLWLGQGGVPALDFTFEPIIGMRDDRSSQKAGKDQEA